jgi:Uma2 family endonuclease
LKRATYEDVLSAPENKFAEILDGELFLSPRPSPRHSVASSSLLGALVSFAGREGPDWVCEVLCPSTERIDRARKLRIYAEAGVAHAWLVNPLEGTRRALPTRSSSSWAVSGWIRRPRRTRCGKLTSSGRR